jgi:hypothetical protein
MDDKQKPARQRLEARAGQAQAAIEVTFQGEQVTFTREEQRALVMLRWRARQRGSLAQDGTLTTQELARLRFVRWLHRTGR